MQKEELQELQEESNSICERGVVLSGTERLQREHRSKQQSALEQIKRVREETTRVSRKCRRIHDDDESEEQDSMEKDRNESKSSFSGTQLSRESEEEQEEIVFRTKKFRVCRIVEEEEEEGKERMPSEKEEEKHDCNEHAIEKKDSEEWEEEEEDEDDESFISDSDDAVDNEVVAREVQTEMACLTDVLGTRTSIVHAVLGSRPLKKQVDFTDARFTLFAAPSDVQSDRRSLFDEMIAAPRSSYAKTRYYIQLHDVLRGLMDIGGPENRERMNAVLGLASQNRVSVHALTNAKKKNGWSKKQKFHSHEEETDACFFAPESSDDDDDEFLKSTLESAFSNNNNFDCSLCNIRRDVASYLVLLTIPTRQQKQYETDWSLSKTIFCGSRCGMRVAFVSRTFAILNDLPRCVREHGADLAFQVLETQCSFSHQFIADSWHKEDPVFF